MIQTASDILTLYLESHSSIHSCGLFSGWGSGLKLKITIKIFAITSH
jgi:hypothetical protein